MKHKYTFKTFIIDCIYDLIGCCLYGIAINCFVTPMEFASGGLSGIALLFYYVLGLPTGVTQFILNIPLIIFAYKILGRTFMLKSIKSLVFLTLAFDYITIHLPKYNGDPILACICIGLCVGSGLGVVYLRGSSTGGSDFVTLSVRKLKPHMSVGTISATFDYVVLGASAIIIGNIDAALYGAVAMFIAAKVLDGIMYGSSKGKMLMIVTDKGQEIADKLSETIERGSTICDVRGGYKGDPRQLVISTVSKQELPTARKAAYLVDNKCFTMITNTDEVFGEGFIDPRDD